MNWVDVDPGVTGATISGTAAISPAWLIRNWGVDAEITRQYPMLVQDPDTFPVPYAEVWVTDAAGELVWSGFTDGTGYAYPEITFDQYTYDTEFRLHAWVPGGLANAPVRLFSSTPITLTLTTNTLSYTSFEFARYPWTTFAAGPGEAVTWRQIGEALYKGVPTPLAHSGEYLIGVDVTGEGISGIRLDLPVGPTPLAYALRTWTYPDARTEGDSSAFFGFALSDTYPVWDRPWEDTLGWEVLSATNSLWHLGSSTTALPVGLSLDRWHLVALDYDRELHTVSLTVDGMPVHEADASALATTPPRWAWLGVSGTDPVSQQYVGMDDASLVLRWPVGATMPAQAHPYALLEGPEIGVEAQTRSYVVRYGNGYPVLGVGSQLAPVGQQTHVGLSLPEGYTLIGATPAPSRSNGGALVWDTTMPGIGEEGEIALELQRPAGASEERMPAWASVISEAGSGYPPTPPEWSAPTDPVWGAPQDILPQRVLLDTENLPDIVVHKSGPPTASPGDSVPYIISVTNQGVREMAEVVVKDDLPFLLGGGEKIVANLVDFAPGDKWRGLLTSTLPWGVPDGTLILNRAYVPTGAAELSFNNNEAFWETTVTAAHDPNQITVTPTGGAQRGDLLTYTLECENVGAGRAYGVYASTQLDSQLDDGTLALPEGMLYDPVSRTLLWEVGTLEAGQGASTTFSASVASTAKRARPIIGHATVYFPSVPEETPTNVVANIVQSTFSDVAWDSWAILPIEQTYEHGIVQGYPDGTYRPAVIVNRGQMATYVARTLASGEALVPSGPATATFTDVPVDNPYFKYVEYAVDQNVVQGYSDNTYRPAVLVNRGQMAIYIARALVAPGGDAAVPPGPGTPSFPDIPADAQAYRQIEYIVSRGVVGGYPDGTYRPLVNVTRDQMAVYVARAFALPQ